MNTNISNPPNNIPQAVEWLIAIVQQQQKRITGLQSGGGSGGGSIAIGQTIGNSPISNAILYSDFQGKVSTSPNFRLSPDIGVTIYNNDLQETDANGLTVSNSTLATSDIPIQISPAIIMEGTAWDPSGMASSTQSINLYLQPNGSDMRPYMYADIVIDGVRTSNIFSIGITGYFTCAGGYVVAPGGIQVVQLNPDGLFIQAGSNRGAGTATLSSGTVTVSNTTIQAGDRIMLSLNTPSGTTGIHYSAPVGSIITNTSFVINSISVAGSVVTTDNSTVDWLIVHN